MATLAEIETLTKAYAYSRSQLSSKVQDMREELAVIEKKHIAGIKRLVAIAKTYESQLHNAIEDSPHLFEKPKSKILYGIRIGFQKQKGSISWADDDIVIKLIRKHFPEMEDILIKTEEKPLKDALGKLPAQDLKKLGVEITDAGDEVIIRPTDTDVDKLVKALLKEKEEEAREAA
jgi:hypothetical protein